MSVTEDTLDLDLREITLQLQQVKLEQERLERRLHRAQERLRERDERLVEERIQGTSAHRRGSHSCHNNNNVEAQVVWIPARRERAYEDSLRPKRGHQVRILNPKVGQRNVGVITGFCADGKLKIRTTNDVIITRWAKNVHRLS